MSNTGITINTNESEYDTEKLVCAWCYGHVDKKLFAETFIEQFFTNGIVEIDENNVCHAYVQSQHHLDGEHLFFDKYKNGKDFLDKCNPPSPVTVINGGCVNHIYKRLRARSLFIKEFRKHLGEGSHILMTTEAYKIYKYDEDYVDVIFYNKDTYAHIILFDNNVTVFGESGEELMNTFFEHGDFNKLITEAIDKIK